MIYTIHGIVNDKPFDAEIDMGDDRLTPAILMGIADEIVDEDWDVVGKISLVVTRHGIGEMVLEVTKLTGNSDPLGDRPTLPLNS